MGQPISPSPVPDIKMEPVYEPTSRVNMPMDSSVMPLDQPVPLPAHEMIKSKEEKVEEIKRELRTFPEEHLTANSGHISANTDIRYREIPSNVMTHNFNFNGQIKNGQLSDQSVV